MFDFVLHPISFIKNAVNWWWPDEIEIVRVIRPLNKKKVPGKRKIRVIKPREKFY